MSSYVGTVVPVAGGKEALVATKEGIIALNLASGETTMIGNPEDKPDNRFNDGKCSPEGRFWVGTMGVPGKVLPGIGSLFVLERDRKTFRKVLSNTFISNGIAWSLDSKTMYYIDSPTKLVQAFDYD